VQVLCKEGLLWLPEEKENLQTVPGILLAPVAALCEGRCSPIESGAIIVSGVTDLLRQFRAAPLAAACILKFWNNIAP
jgi:hypothetical protein